MIDIEPDFGGLARDCAAAVAAEHGREHIFARPSLGRADDLRVEAVGDQQRGNRAIVIDAGRGEHIDAARFQNPRDLGIGLLRIFQMLHHRARIGEINRVRGNVLHVANIVGKQLHRGIVDSEIDDIDAIKLFRLADQLRQVRRGASAADIEHCSIGPQPFGNRPFDHPVGVGVVRKRGLELFLDRFEKSYHRIRAFMTCRRRP